MDYWTWHIKFINGTEIRCDSRLILPYGWGDENLDRFTEEINLFPGNYVLYVSTDAYGGGFWGRERVEMTAIINGTSHAA